MANQTKERQACDGVSTKPPAVILLADSFRQSGIDALESLGCHVHMDATLCGEALADAIASSDPDVLIVRSTKVSSEMLDASEKLSVVIRAGAGYDTIDVAAASARGISVANCPNKNSIAVAELTWSLILSCDRRVPDQVIDLRSGKWKKKEYSNAMGLHGRTLGVIGLGSIGREVATLGKAFGMHVIAWSRSLTNEGAKELGVNRCESLVSLAQQSDVVTVHVAACSDTIELLDADFFLAMQDGATFVNTSRGNLIDEEALVSAVQTKQLRVGIDVYKNEPSSSDETFTPEIVKQCCVYGTHHVGASTEQSQEAIAMEAVRIISEYVINGTVPNCVNRAASTPAKALLCVRHRNLPGVLAHVFD